MGFACQTSAFGLLPPRAREVYFMNMQKTNVGKEKIMLARKRLGLLDLRLRVDHWSCGQVILHCRALM